LKHKTVLLAFVLSALLCASLAGWAQGPKIGLIYATPKLEELEATNNDLMNLLSSTDVQGQVTGMTYDADGDDNPGITGIPRGEPPFSLPLLNILSGASADRLYLVTRTILTLEGTRETCSSTRGVATVTHFDNHVVGCNVLGASTCDDFQRDFVDNARTVYNLHEATYESKRLSENATCADVRNAFPR